MMSAPPRSAAFALTLAVHGGVLAGLLMQPRAQAAEEPAAIAMFDVVALPAPPAPPAPAPKPPQPEPVPPIPPEPLVVPPPPLPLPSEMVVAMLEQSETQAEGGACDLTAPVQAALQQSAEVQAALARIPRKRRSVANAIMVWDATWIAPDMRLDPAILAVIRDTVAGTVAAASEACRRQPQGGPRLVMASTVDETVLAMGSGMWSWQALLDTARPGEGSVIAVEIAQQSSNPSPRGASVLR